MPYRDYMRRTLEIDSIRLLMRSGVLFGL